MIDPHNLLVSIHSDENKIISDIKYGINYTLSELKNKSMVITGDNEKDSKNNFYLINILKVMDKMDEITEKLESHENWYNEYMTKWKGEKDKS